METESQARRLAALEKLRTAIARAGGAREVARKIGSTRTHVWNVMHGVRGLGRLTQVRLRTVVRLDAKTWLTLAEPGPTVKRSATTEASQ
jgi:hypothetical protein